MTGIDPTISQLADFLAAIVEAEDSRRLLQYLSGRKLPAIGGDLDPADIILQTIPLIQEPPDFPNRLARVLAFLIEKETVALEDTPRRQTILQNALYLAAELPAEKVLCDSLKELLKVLRTMPQEDGRSSRLQLSLWQALVYQQNDTSLEAEWFSILEPSESASWSTGRRTLLLTAWRGLLWIPPSLERRKSGEIVDFERIKRALLALYKVTKGQDEALPILMACMDILQETYPRSAEFWASKLTSQAADWPGELRSMIFERWVPSAEVGLGDSQLVALESESRLVYSENSPEAFQAVIDEKGVTLYRVLAVNRHLPPQEEIALSEMLEDFHRMVRDFHRRHPASQRNPTKSRVEDSKL